MIRVVNVVYHAQNDLLSPCAVIQKQAPSFGYIPFLKGRVSMLLVKHFRERTRAATDGVPVWFFTRRNGFWQVPFATHRFIRSARPDLVLVEGLIFPLQVLFLRLALPRSCRIVAQHHGELPWRGYRRWFQRAADRCIDGYLFTALGNSRKWISNGTIRHARKCHEVLEASVLLQPQNKLQCRRRLDLPPATIFLWVGRLNLNKDPLTVLRAFEQYLRFNTSARLYMIYQTTELLDQVLALLHQHPPLQKAVTLAGPVPQEELAAWYSAADFYVSASHEEGSGYALLEAMACGCVPVVTGIPSFRKITGGGAVGFLYEPGRSDQLLEVLKQLPLGEWNALSEKVRDHFSKHLSFRQMADDMYKVFLSLQSK